MPVPPKYADLEIYFQCRIPNCQARCQRSPKDSGRLSDHWKMKHIDEHGPFKGREVLVKIRNEDGTFSTITFDSYAIANGIKYKTQDASRPTRHAKLRSTTSSSTAPRSKSSHAPMEINSSLLVGLSITSVPAIAQTTSNVRRVARMERQLRVASMPHLHLQLVSMDRHMLDSHPAQSLPCRSVSNRLPLKRNLSTAFREIKSSSNSAETDSIKINVQGSFDFASAPASSRSPFSQMPVSHLRPPKAAPAPVVSTAFNATQALRGTIHLPSHLTNDVRKDYSQHTWNCKLCHVEFPDMATVTEHLRDRHAVENDVVTSTPGRDVVTMVLASVKVDDEGHGWADGNGKAIGETKKSKHDARAASVGDDTETDDEMQSE